MHYLRFKITRDAHTIYNVNVPKWEAAVMAMVFDEGNVQPLNTFELVDRPYPDAGFEFDRLIRAYGADPKSGVPYAAAVYGNAGAGIRALAAAIAEAQTEDEAAQAAAPKPAARRPRRAPTLDALLS